MHLHKNTLFYIDLGAKVTQDLAKYPLYRVTYSDTKFEVATSDRLEKKSINKKKHYLTVDTKCLPVISA